MADKIASRATQVDVHKCIKNTGSQFDLVLVAAQRTRELRKQADYNAYVSPIDALLEIEEGKVDADDYLLRAVKNQQKYTLKIT
jgi:DNA-directed RNA polymerase omega subunit